MRIAPFTFLASLLVMTQTVPGQSLNVTGRTAIPGTVTGYVTVDGEPASRIQVVLYGYKYEYYQGDVLGPVVASATSDNDGRYALTVPNPGEYSIAAIGRGLIPAFQKSPATWWNVPSRMIKIAEGETVSGINLGLIRTGSISGRVTDPEGQPIAGRWMTLIFVDENGQETSFTGPPGSSVVVTGSDGAYKFDALAPGRYKVGVMGAVGGKDGKFYHDAYYPGAYEPAGATVINVKAGVELSNIDLSPGPPIELHKVSGLDLNSANRWTID